MIRLAVGDGEPTAAEGAAAPAREARAAGSVLAASGAEPVPLLFPDDTPAADAAPAVAADGTVSVLLRDGGPAEGSAPTGRPAAEAQPALDDARQAPGCRWARSRRCRPAAPRRRCRTCSWSWRCTATVGVRGNYFDALADSVQPVAGRLDRQTGTVTWRVARGPECTTAAEGLTSGRAEVRVEGPGGERTWTLVSLE